MVNDLIEYSNENQNGIANPSLIVEEKVDGTNVGIHFTSGGRMVLQCRGHEITEGMHPQYDLFKQWTSVKRPVLEGMLGGQFILYGEWLYAKHSVHYRKLPHYFFEFDIYDKDAEQFLDLTTRVKMLDGTGLHTVPVVKGRLFKPHANSAVNICVLAAVLLSTRRISRARCGNAGLTSLPIMERGLRSFTLNRQFQ